MSGTVIGRATGIGRRTNRGQRGSAAFELAAGALITIGIVAFALNVCFAMLSYSINDHACRDAARAAAQAPSAAQAFIMASNIVKSYNSNNGLLSPITVRSVLYTDFSGNPPAGQSPFVTVTTTSNATMPAPIEFFGKTLFGSSIPVSKTYAFPIIRLTVPNT